MNADDVLRYGHLTLLGTLQELPAGARDQPGACGTWSVKDIVAHLASYELVLLDILRTAAGEASAAPHLDRFVSLGPAFNDAEVAARRDATFETVLAELDDAHAGTLRVVARIPAERLRETGTLSWYGDAYALDDLIVYQYYGHKREHGAQVAAFRDHAARLGQIANMC